MEDGAGFPLVRLPEQNQPMTGGFHAPSPGGRKSC
jgi:hypothetical protein